MKKSVLVVDDEIGICQSLSGVLQDEGFEVDQALCEEEALFLANSKDPDIILLDVWITGSDGIELLKKFKKDRPSQLVILMSGHGTIETAVKATKLGAFDFIEKPLSIERLLLTIQNALQSKQLVLENQSLRCQVQKNKSFIGNSPNVKRLKEMIAKVAPTTGSVLILGENGTGKELIAQLIHSQSLRFQKPLIEVNCAAIPEELIESELFGHEKGSFSGALQMRRGKFDLAHGGTLFLDEIADMSLRTQAKILRILQEQKFERVGGSQTIHVNVRIIAATNKNLTQMIAQGSFREDLFYRLNVIPFVIPPLRERREDVPLLIQHFLREFCFLHSKRIRTFSESSLEVMLEHPWPGNVRELRNLIERIVILEAPKTEGDVIELSELLEHFHPETKKEKVWESEPIKPERLAEFKAESLKAARAAFEKQFILEALNVNQWNISKTAQNLGLERSHLHRKIKAYALDHGQAPCLDSKLKLEESHAEI